ncbi:ATP-binding protein [Planotetraspora kaengkrachanensis]|uniref:ATP-binding protein n=1 Tax=Planotetraspora kaengkrachanensis TaxID=575193 RepID=UPI001941701A|nr:ATP-binding protein [Planotetraspora kaengkrachanensis]
MSSLLTLEFELGSITRVRHLVTESARDAGLGGAALEDFVLAVHEALTNAVRHGLPPRGIAMWVDSGLLICEVSDGGPGIPAQALDRDYPSTRFDFGGRGLWLMNRLARREVRTGPHGTTLRLCTKLP